LTAGFANEALDGSWQFETMHSIPGSRKYKPGIVAASYPVCKAPSSQQARSTASLTLTDVRSRDSLRGRRPMDRDLRRRRSSSMCNTKQIPDGDSYPTRTRDLLVKDAG